MTLLSCECGVVMCTFKQIACTLLEFSVLSGTSESVSYEQANRAVDVESGLQETNHRVLHYYM